MKPPDRSHTSHPSDGASNQGSQESEGTTEQRSTAAVATGSSTQTRLQRQLAVLVLGGLGATLLVWYYTSAYAKMEQARSKVEHRSTVKAQAESTLPPVDFALLRKRGSPDASTAPETQYRIGSVLGDWRDPTTAKPSGSAQPTPCCTPPNPARTQKSPEELREDRLLTGNVFTRAKSTLSIDEAEPTKGSEESNAQAPTTAQPLNALLTSSSRPPLRASLLPTQRLMLPKGNFLDCTLETAIDSTLPGMATCLTAVDSFSSDGSVVLLERGTKLIGETRGEVAQGSSRVFVLWNEARTPDGVVVPLASPGTDTLGRSGLSGSVNRHFWDRFGAAILVSLIDGTVQGLAQRDGSDGTVVVNPNATQDITTEVLKGTISIPPSVQVRQGSRIQVLVARDLDFRGVYQLKAR